MIFEIVLEILEYMTNLSMSIFANLFPNLSIRYTESVLRLKESLMPSLPGGLGSAVGSASVS